MIWRELSEQLVAAAIDECAVETLIRADERHQTDLVYTDVTGVGCGTPHRQEDEQSADLRAYQRLGPRQQAVVTEVRLRCEKAGLSTVPASLYLGRHGERHSERTCRQAIGCSDEVGQPVTVDGSDLSSSGSHSINDMNSSEARGYSRVLSAL